MAKKKNYWYVLVLNNYGPVFVTNIPGRHTAEWKKDEAPLELSESYAKDIAWGLRLNGYSAFAVDNSYEMHYQPYRYEDGQFKWEWNEDAKKEGKVFFKED